MKAAENPFRSSEIDKVRFCLSGEDLSAMAGKAMNNPFRCCCILGPEGSGKTTLLEDLEPLLRRSNLSLLWFRLTGETSSAGKNAAVRSICALGPGDLCLLDGGEVLGWLAWLRIRRSVMIRQSRLIATLHRSRGLTVLHRTRPDWQTTSNIVMSLAGHYMCPHLESVARTAFEDSRGNVREVFRACYMSLMDGECWTNPGRRVD